MIIPSALNQIIRELETIMESDKRTFSNRETDEDWYFDGVYNALKILKTLSIDERLSKE